ncbi:MAG: hypothetical protein J0M10_01235 [Chitinophagales bacterium]|nr:hypothetical protein [Chitinophagales bacterium]
MMYEFLYQYLLRYKQVTLPGIGRFELSRIPATVNFPEKRIDAPAYKVTHLASGAAPSHAFFTWLGSALQVSEREAVIRFNDFAFDLKKSISKGAVITWNGVGQLSKGLAGNIRFVADPFSAAEKAVSAERLIREKAAHKVRVGEQERSSEEMEAFLNQPEAKRDFWWAWALAAGILAVMYIGWHLSSTGVQLASTANRGKSPLKDAPSTYRMLP